MAPTSSSDSESPKSISSSSCNRTEDEEGDEGNPKSIHQSSDESTTSDGVLVDLPSNADGGGILVNVDGREDLFVDASEELGSARSIGRLDESVAIVEYGESSGLDQLEEAIAQCRKYKEERQVFGREISSFRHQLQEMFRHRLSPSTRNAESIELLHQMERGGEDEAFKSPTPLHMMINDCSKILSHLSSILNDQSNSEDTIKCLNAVICTKEQEVEDINLKLAESNLCQDVVISYLGSVREIWSKSLKESSDEISNRLLSSLETVIGCRSCSEDSIGDGISLVEKKTLSLIEKHAQLLSETRQLWHFLAEARPELKSSEENDFCFTYSIARDELLANRNKEALFLQKISELEDENRRMADEINKMKEGLEMANAETNKTKMELEHAENKLAAAREKLSIAVAKGKSLVQHRDTLKQMLAEKTSELENCAHELHQKSSALEALEASAEGLKQLLAEKTNELQNCLFELQQKSTALETTETCALEMNNSLTEKTSQLEKCLLELQQKSQALENTEASAEALKQSLVEKVGELDTCLLELGQKSDTLANSETNCKELKQSLAEKNVELDKCLLELHRKSDALEATEVRVEEQIRMLAQKTIEFENCFKELQTIRTSENIVEELKMSLSENAKELEKCQLELQEKSDTLKTAINSNEKSDTLVKSLQCLLSERERVLNEIEETLRQADLEDDLLSIEVVDRVKWFVNLKHNFDAIMSQNKKLKDTLSSIHLPATISSTDLGSQIEWLVESFAQAKEDVIKMEEEIAGIRFAMASHESKLSETRKEIDHLTASLSEVKQEKDFVQGAHDDLKRRYKKFVDILSLVSSENDGRAKELEVTSARALDNQLHLDTDLLIEKSITAISERKKLSLTKSEQFEEMQSLLYVTHLELMLCKNILEEETICISEVRILSNELRTALQEVVTLKNEKEALQKELERVEEKSSLIREKLSMAVKKGKGLVQEREGFKQSLDEKNFEIKKLKEELQLWESAILEYKKRIESLSAYPEQIQKLESDIASLKDQRAQSDGLLLESNNMLQKLVETIEDMVLPSDKNFEKPAEKLYWVAEYISKSEVALVQEREGFKQSLDEKISEIKKLKEELQLQESAIVEHKKQIESLSAYPEQIQKLESDIASLKDQRAQSESLLLESNNLLQKLVETIEDMVLPSDKNLEKPVEKLYWVAEYISESEAAKAHREQELEEVKSEAAFQSSRSADTLATVERLKDELPKAEKHIFNIVQEKKDMKLVILNIEQELEKLKEVSTMQASKLEDAYATIRSLEDQLDTTNIEQELEKLKEESSMQASRLEDAFTTIKSLEDALAQSSNNISTLEAEKEEIKSKSQQQIDALNARLTDCLEELVGIRSSFEDQSGELVGQIEDLRMFMKDDDLSSLMTEEFRKKTQGLRHICILVQDMHDQFTAKGLRSHTGSEASNFAKFSSLLKFEDFINDGMFNRKITEEEFSDATALSKIVQGLRCQAKLLGNWFQGLSRFLDDHIAIISQNLRVVMDEFFHMLELSESLRLTVNKLEPQNQTREVEISSLKKGTMHLLSACQDAIQELQIEFRDLLEFYPEQDITSSSLCSQTMEAVEGGLEQGDSGEYNKAAANLLLATRRIRIQAEQLISVNKALITSVNDLKDKLLQANLTAETAIQDRQLSQEKLLMLEGNLENLQNICSEMRVKMEENQATKSKLRDKEAELSSLQDASAAKEGGICERLFVEGQLEALIDKVNKLEIPFNESNKMEIPFNESKPPIPEFHFSNPMDKLFYVLDNFTELQHRVDSFTYEKEDMQIILESHVREIEHHKETAETVGTNYQDLESKKLDLIELTVGLEKLIQRFGENNLSDARKPSSVKGLLQVLERIMVTSNSELEISKSRMKELGAKIQATENAIDELSTKNKVLEDSMRARLTQPDIVKEKTAFDASSTAMGSEISEIEDVGTLGKNMISPPAAHVRTMRKGSNDHLVLNIDSDSDRLISVQEIDDKGHVFKSLNTTGLIPKQGKLIADRVDSFWVSGGRVLMNRPRARLGLIAYWIFLHLWLLGTIL